MLIAFVMLAFILLQITPHRLGKTTAYLIFFSGFAEGSLISFSEASDLHLPRTCAKSKPTCPTPSDLHGEGNFCGLWPPPFMILIIPNFTKPREINFSGGPERSSGYDFSLIQREPSLSCFCRHNDQAVRRKRSAA